ncbi:hypothetical protein ACHAAC_06710 [Aeromicrobium sp. CF4.19]|uniref:hypothetical protein n=1 Tax=Aeromicrobium sp. CF4.19 TaxID=3373082 RepID=UPI003EE7EDCB
MMELFTSMWDASNVPSASIEKSALASEPLGVKFDWKDFTTSQQREDLSLLGSEALHGLRTCLDLLVYEASERDSGKARSGTKFPAVETPTAWDDRSTRKSVKWLSSEHRSWIRDVQPFAGVAWAGDLIRFSNADKHRSAVELSPTLRFRVDRNGAYADPSDPGRLRLPVSEVELHLLVTDGKKSVPLADVFPAMMNGVAALLDKFRAEHGEPSLGLSVEITKPWRRAK